MGRKAQKQRKQSDSVSPNEMIRFATGSEVLEIIHGVESPISRNRLFPMGWPSFRFAVSRIGLAGRTGRPLFGFELATSGRREPWAAGPLG
jgi:hypothetical protein